MKNLKLYNQFYEARKVKDTEYENGYDQKDVDRIDDIIEKADGTRDKEKQLATTMANRITDISKAKRRGNAAEDRGYKYLAKIFFDRAKTLK